MDQEEIEQCCKVIDKLIVWSEKMSHQTSSDMIDVAGIIQRVVERERIKDDNKSNEDNTDDGSDCGCSSGSIRVAE